MRTNTKAVHEAFLDQIRQDFAAHGITPVVNRYGEEEYTVQTIVGPYTCHAQKAFGTGRVKLRFLSLMGRFADPAKARTQVDCNPHNGKWNFDGQGNRKTEIEARGLASCITSRILNLQSGNH